MSQFFHLFVRIPATVRATAVEPAARRPALRGNPAPPPTEAMVEVEGEGMRELTWVVIEEVKQGDWAIGPKIPRPKPKA